ncbi:MAG: type II toxin-antitoxin system HipA family toxin [Lentisphaerae bacterium]|jgi:serine/threonine-protein kinase HipA|nr:type II toxin-antitoxin system HipA family toxin [Lentisphaerota bacterium]
MKRLIVYLNGERVGSLTEDDSGLIEFRYAPEWTGRSDAIPLSRSLPLQGGTFRGKHARPFFAGILPDEEPRKLIAAILGISERNDFAMLERIGGECAGAVSLLPEDAPAPVMGETRVRELSERELEEIVTELPRRPLMAGREGLRLSLAGAQSKLPVMIRNAAIALPLGNTPSTHIIKPEPERFPGLVANEVLCMMLARAVGLNVPPVTVRSVGNRPCIVVQRYDRAIDANGMVTRVHQEDFCQALGFPPERKYQQEGGPLIRDCIGLLREWSTVAALDIRDFLDGLIFNVLIGNADAHGKNYSILYRKTERRLAPFYDLVCTLAWPELSKTPAMKIGKSESIETITPAHWQKMAGESRVGWPMLRERIAGLCGKCVDALQDEAVLNAVNDPVMAERVAGIIQERASSLLQSMK